MSRPLVLGDVMVDVVARLSRAARPGSDSHARDPLPRRRIRRQHGGLAGTGREPSRCWWAAWATTSAAAPCETSCARPGWRLRSRSTRSCRPARASCSSDPTASARWLPTPARTTASPRPTCRRAARVRRPPARGWLRAAPVRIAARRARGDLASARARVSVSVDPSSAALLSPEFLDHAARRGICCCRTRRKHRCSAASAIPRAPRRALAARFSEVVVTLGADGALWTDGRRERASRRGPGGGRGGQHRRGRRVRRGAAGGASGGCGARGGAGGGGAAGR